MLKTLRYFYTTAWRERKGYFFFLCADIGLHAGHPFINLILSRYLLEELAGRRAPETLAQLAAAIALGNLLFLCLIHLAHTRLANYDDWFDRYFNDLLSRKVMMMDYPLTEEPAALDRRRKAEDGMSWYSDGMRGLSGCVRQLVSYLLMMAGVVAIVAVKSPFLLVVALFAVAGGSFAVWQTNKCYQIEFEQFPKVNRAFHYVTADVLRPQFAKSIRLYGGARMMREQFVQTTGQCSDIFYYTANLIGRWNCVGSLVNFLKNLCVYGYLSIRLLTGHIGIGDFTMLSGVANTLKDSLQGVLNQLQELRRKLNFMGQYVTFMETEDSVRTGKLSVDTGQIPCIEFKHVSFRYPGMQDDVLRDISLTIPSGQHLSIVGLNGAGKTTFIKLLCRLYDVSEGEILLNGVNIREYDYDSYCKALSVVFQDFKMFALSMRDNIRLGDWEKEERDMEEICARSGLAQRVASLPKGLDTQIYKCFDADGIEPSGGEMQKLAIARALYRDAPVVILDEPTAALDPVAEYDVYRQFDTLVGGKTAIYISHRLSSCKFCDKIAVFADHTVREYGTHDELVGRTDGIYAEMFRAQAQYYA